MEIPAVVLLYAALLAGAVASLFYVFTVYDGAVYSINSHACREATYLVQIALQRAMEEPGNYTAKINLYYPVKITGGEITVGLDTRKPATCRINAPQGRRRAGLHRHRHNSRKGGTYKRVRGVHRPAGRPQTRH
jgi:hypothetical protein